MHFILFFFFCMLRYTLVFNRKAAQIPRTISDLKEIQMLIMLPVTLMKSQISSSLLFTLKSRSGESYELPPKKPSVLPTTQDPYYRRQLAERQGQRKRKISGSISFFPFLKPYGYFKNNYSFKNKCLTISFISVDS